MSLTKAVAMSLVLALVLPLGCQADSKSKAPNFALKTQDGKTVELRKLEGKVVVVNFWATWCGPCRAEIPGMLEVYNKYKSQGLEIIGVSLDRGGWNQVAPFVQKLSITYPVVVGDGELADKYGGIEAIPTTFIVDKKGKIVQKHIGYFSKEKFEEQVKRFL